LTQPKILIFDEATSALDVETEQVIQRNMAAICADRTVIIIAHRLSAVRQAHQILAMDGGRIVEHGTHAELMGRAGYYAQLMGVQATVMV
jgi:subfamily B ATP-binding cassette protein HlyB/CyaB